MMEQPDSRKAHDHVVQIAGLDDIVIPHRSAGFRHIAHAALKRPLDIVPEGEERIRP